MDETSTRGRLTYGGYNPEYQTDPAADAPMNVAFRKVEHAEQTSISTGPLLCSSRGGYAQNRKFEARWHSMIQELEEMGCSVWKTGASA